MKNNDLNTVIFSHQKLKRNNYNFVHFNPLTTVAARWSLLALTTVAARWSLLPLTTVAAQWSCACVSKYNTHTHAYKQVGRDIIIYSDKSAFRVFQHFWIIKICLRNKPIVSFIWGSKNVRVVRHFFMVCLLVNDIFQCFNCITDLFMTLNSDSQFA